MSHRRLRSRQALNGRGDTIIISILYIDCVLFKIQECVLLHADAFQAGGSNGCQEAVGSCGGACPEAGLEAEQAGARSCHVPHSGELHTSPWDHPPAS